MKPNIDLHIDELVLRGFRNEDRYRIAAAVKTELVRQLTARGMAESMASGFSAARVDGGGFNTTPDAPAETVGAQIARSIYGGIGK